jgi:NAD(P)-dependent dehydrogenase (short-subunit alcohol dehydrogenase family)
MLREQMLRQQEIKVMKFDQSVALVSGANRGLGQALVAELLTRGVKRVYVGMRDLAQAERVLSQDPARIVPLRLDLTSPEQIARAAEQARDVTVLFNNAGLLGAYDLLDTPLSVLQRDFDTNFFGHLALTRTLLPALLHAAPRAAIVNVLTVASLASMPALGGYSASKAAAFSMTQALRAQLQDRGLTVHAVFPGPVDTDMVRAFDLPKASPASVARAIVEGVERGDEDIWPDPMAKEVSRTYATSPKALERQFAAHR